MPAERCPVHTDARVKILFDEDGWIKEVSFAKKGKLVETLRCLSPYAATSELNAEILLDAWVDSHEPGALTVNQEELLYRQPKEVTDYLESVTECYVEREDGKVEPTECA